MSVTQSPPGKAIRVMRVLVPLLSIPLAVILLWLMLAMVSTLPEAPKGDTSFAWASVIWPVYAGWLLLPLTFIYAFRKPMLTLVVSCSVIFLFFMGLPLFISVPGDGFPLTPVSIVIALIFALLAMVPTVVMWFVQTRAQPSIYASN